MLNIEPTLSIILFQRKLESPRLPPNDKVLTRRPRHHPEGLQLLIHDPKDLTRVPITVEVDVRSPVIPSSALFSKTHVRSLWPCYANQAKTHNFACTLLAPLSNLGFG